MPVVHIHITREGTTPGATAATPAEKAAVIKGVSEVLRDVLHKPLDSTFVIIDEVPLENWGWGGLAVPDYRRQKQAQTSDELSGETSVHFLD